MGVIRVSAEELKRKADELQKLNENLKSQVSELEENEQRLMTMWDGAAKEQFHHQFRSDKVQIDNFIRLILDYIRALLAIMAEYDRAERANVETAITRKYK